MVIIPLTQGQFAVVDDCDEHVNKWKWLAWRAPGKRVAFYAARAVTVAANKQRLVMLHHLIVGFPILKNNVVDHINRNTLDNRRENLRIITQRENQWNRSDRAKAASQMVGVHWSKKAQTWSSSISIKGRKVFLGYFPTEADAANAYRSAIPLEMPTMISKPFPQSVSRSRP